MLSTRESTIARKKCLSRAITMVQVRSLETAEVTNSEQEEEDDNDNDDDDDDDQLRRPHSIDPQHLSDDVAVLKTTVKHMHDDLAKVNTKDGTLTTEVCQLKDNLATITLQLKDYVATITKEKKQKKQKKHDKSKSKHKKSKKVRT